MHLEAISTLSDVSFGRPSSWSINSPCFTKENISVHRTFELRIILVFAALSTGKLDRNRIRVCVICADTS
jgi:hypothetical protein